MSRGTGRLSLAIALISGMASLAAQNIKETMGEAKATMLGYHIKADLQNHYRSIHGARKGGAAALKRASKKRRNINKRKGIR